MQRYTIEISGKSYVVDVDEKGGEMYQVLVDGKAFDVRLAAGVDAPTLGPATETAAAAEIEGVAFPSGAEVGGGTKTDVRMKTDVRAPMPGVVLSVAVQPGDRVSVAQQLIVLEAMKMKNPISSPRDGVVSEVVVQEGQSVGYNDVLLKFEEA